MSNHLVPTLTFSDFLEILTKFDLILFIGKSKILAQLDKWKIFKRYMEDGSDYQILLQIIVSFLPYAFEFDFRAKYLSNTHEICYSILLIAKNPKISIKIPQNVMFHENCKVKGAGTSAQEVVFGRIFKGKKLEG